jgi:hypothetical protein
MSSKGYTFDKYLLNMCMPSIDFKAYTPDFHLFEYTASVHWPETSSNQLDWIDGIQDVERWLIDYTGPKYSRWAWNWSPYAYDISVAFKFDKHRTLFLLRWV